MVIKISQNRSTRKEIAGSIRSALYSIMNWLTVLESEIEDKPETQTTEECETAEWVMNDKGEYVCSKCGHDIPFDTDAYYTQAGKIVEWFSAYCPNCGRRMKNENSVND